MKIRLFLLVVMFAVPALAQSPNAQFAWALPDSPQATCAAYRVDLELDGALQTAPLTPVCTPAGAGSTVTAAIPPVTPGDHTARIRLVDVSSPPFSPILGPWSDPHTFTMKVTPPKPVNFRIVPVPVG